MTKWVCLLLSVLTIPVIQAADVYHQVKEIAIGGEGGWDYLIVDPAARRLYTSHTTKIVVADIDTGKL